MTYQPTKTVTRGAYSFLLTGASSLAGMLLFIPEMCNDPYTMSAIAAIGTGLTRMIANFAKHHNDA